MSSQFETDTIKLKALHHSKIHHSSRFVLGISSYVVISYYQCEDEDAKKIGNEPQVLIIDHLHQHKTIL